MASYDSSLAVRVQALLDAKLPTDGLSAPVRLHSTASGTKWHGSDSCRQLTLYRHAVVLASIDLGTLCSCVRAVDGPVMQYLLHAEFLIQVRTWLEQLSGRQPSLSDVALARSLQQRSRQYTNQAHRDLVPLLQTVVHDCHRALQTPGMRQLTDRERELLLHRWWCETVQTITGDAAYSQKVVPPHDGVDLSLFQDRSYSSGLEPLQETWKIWSAAVHSGADTAESARLAEAAGRAKAGDAPMMLSQVPQQSALNAADFDTAAQWATAEWVLRRDEVLRELVATWQDDAEKQIAAANADREVVFLNLAGVPDKHRADVEQVLAVYGGAVYDQCWLTSVPRLGAERLAELLSKENIRWDAYRAVGFRRLGAAGDITPEVFDTAPQLWAAENHEVEIGEQLDRALLVHR